MRLFAVTIDCSEPQQLASFYQTLLGGTIAATNSTFVALTVEADLRLDFQRVDAYVRPTWPTADTPAQMHLDFVVRDLAEAERRATALGARIADHQPGNGRFRVLLDPEGHPFCIVTPAASTIQ